MLDDLPEIAKVWDEIDGGERVSWSIHWSNEMAGLKQLARYASDGALTGDQLTRYQELLGNVKRALPTLKRLNLYRPRLLIDA